MTRLSVNINHECADALNDLAKRRQTTVTEIIRRAISVYKYLDDAQRDGKSIQLRDDTHITTCELL